MVTYPEDWREEKIEDIFSVITDYVAAGSFADLSQNVVYLKSPDYAQLVRTKDIKSKFTNNDFVYISKSAYEYLWRVHFDKPIIIMPNIGNCGEVYYLEPHMLPYKNSALGPNAIMLKKTTHDMKFLSYALERDDFQSSLADITSPSGQTKFNKTALAKISIVIPECFSEQQAIASVLSDFDEHIDNLSELIEKKKAIRDGALEDLVSGRTRLDGFDGEWVEKNIDDFVKIKRGASPRPIESHLTYASNGINWIKIGDAPRYGKYIETTAEKITQKGAEHSVLVYPGDFILSNSMSFGRPYILRIKGCIHDGWLRLYDFQENSNRDFLFYLLSSHNIQSQYNEAAAGSGVQNLNKEVVKGVKVVLPSLPEQEAIAEVLTAMDDEIESLEVEKEKMLQIKEGAMDDLLTGRVRLKV